MTETSLLWPRVPVTIRHSLPFCEQIIEWASLHGLFRILPFRFASLFFVVFFFPSCFLFAASSFSQWAHCRKGSSRWTQVFVQSTCDSSGSQSGRKSRKIRRCFFQNSCMSIQTREILINIETLFWFFGVLYVAGKAVFQNPNGQRCETSVVSYKFVERQLLRFVESFYRFKAEAN